MTSEVPKWMGQGVSEAESLWWHSRVEVGTSGGGANTPCCIPQVARRCWSGNQKAREIICQTMQENSGLVVTLPHEVADERLLQQALRP